MHADGGIGAHYNANAWQCEHRALRVSSVLKSFYTTFSSAMRLVPIPDYRDPHVLSLGSHVWLRPKAAPGESVCICVHLR